MPASDTGTAPTILWFAAIQSVEGKQYLADLAPKIASYRLSRSSTKLGKLAGLPELAKMVGLHFEQAGFHARGTAKPPQQASQTEEAESRLAGFERPPAALQRAAHRRMR
jgi:hypothetical protein